MSTIFFDFGVWAPFGACESRLEAASTVMDHKVITLR